MPQEWHDRSYWSVMLQTAPEAAELFCNVSLCFVTLSSPPERFPAANGRLGLQRSIWPDPSCRRVGSTAKKMTRHGNTPITHKQKHFDTLFHWKWMNVSAVLRKKIHKVFWLFPRCNWCDSCQCFAWCLHTYVKSDCWAFKDSQYSQENPHQSWWEKKQQRKHKTRRRISKMHVSPDK